MRCSLIIVAAGEGRRMRRAQRGRYTRKPFLVVRGRPVLEWTLRRFHGIPAIRETILVLNEKDMTWVLKKYGRLLGRLGVHKCVPGGRRRQDSVWNGVRHTDPDNDVIMIHDVVRPCVEKSVIRNVMSAAFRYGGAVAAIPVVDTIKNVDIRGRIRATPPRSALWAAQTPQVFRRRRLIRAFQEWRNRRKGQGATDDSVIMEAAGFPVVVVPGNPENIKITTSGDLLRARFLI